MSRSPRVGGGDNKHSLLTAPEAGGPRSECQPGQVLGRAPFLVSGRQTTGGQPVCPSSYEGTSPILEALPM